MSVSMSLRSIMKKLETSDIIFVLAFVGTVFAVRKESFGITILLSTLIVCISGYKFVEREFLESVKKDGMKLRDIPWLFQNNRKIVLAAVKQNARALECAIFDVNYSYRSDREIILEAVKQNPIYITNASQSLLKDKDFLLEAVKANGMALKELPIYDSSYLIKPWTDAMSKNANEIVSVAVEQNGLALKHAPNDLKEKKGIVLLAVNENGEALQFAHGNTKDLLSVRFAAVVTEATRKRLLQNQESNLAGSEKTLNKDMVMKTMKEMAEHLDCSVIHLAAEHGFEWENGLKDLVYKFSDETNVSDKATGLYPFMIAASSNDTDLNTMYNMISCSPELAALDEKKEACPKKEEINTN